MRRPGLTLMELIVALAIVVTLAALVVPLIADPPSAAQETVTRTNMTVLRDAIMGQYRIDMEKRLPRPGYYAMNNPPNRLNKPQLRYLFMNPGPTAAPGAPESTTPSFDPVAAKGWRGPYILQGRGTYTVDLARNFTRDYGETGDPCVMDGWNNPIVIVEVLPNDQLRSAGPDGILMNDDDLTLDLI